MAAVTPEVPTLLSASLVKQVKQTATLPHHVKALVVSPRLEVRKPLLRVLDNLSVDASSCSTKCQAEEVLAQQSFDIVFCDEHLADGSYGDLIHADHFGHKIPRVIVATRVGEWELYFEAMRQGAFDVVRSPWYAPDVEMSVIRALREEEAASTTV